MFLATLLASFGTTIHDMFVEAAHIVAIVWGGLVLWVMVLITRFIIRKSNPRGRR